jgi:hypothetical protein
VGGVKPDGSRWLLTQDKAISHIQDETYVFYIEKPGGQRLDVIVATSAYGNYLKTEADGEQPDKLLSLPTCPGIELAAFIGHEDIRKAAKNTENSYCLRE